MSIEMIVATLFQPLWSECVQTWRDTAEYYLPIRVVPNQTIVHAYQMGALESPKAILGYVHDDVKIHEKGWDIRVLEQFDDPSVSMVGFGGALGHGHPNLYRGEYHLPNLARQGFMSNMRDAERHGQRRTGAYEVSVLDGFAVFVRKEFLMKAGGWPQDGRYGYFLYMEWACCMARRMGYTIRMVGVNCEHLGGKSSGMKQDQVFDYEGEHFRLYSEFRDVLPATVIP